MAAAWFPEKFRWPLNEAKDLGALVMSPNGPREWALRVKNQSHLQVTNEAWVFGR